MDQHWTKTGPKSANMGKMDGNRTKLDKHRTKLDQMVEILHIEEGHELVSDAIEIPRLEAGVSLEGIAMHGITHPNHVAPLLLHCCDELGQIRS